jgi:hypothetical protein
MAIAGDAPRDRGAVQAEGGEQGPVAGDVDQARDALRVGEDAAAGGRVEDACAFLRGDVQPVLDVVLSVPEAQRGDPVAQRYALTDLAQLVGVEHIR